MKKHKLLVTSLVVVVVGAGAAIYYMAKDGMLHLNANKSSSDPGQSSAWPVSGTSSHVAVTLGPLPSPMARRSAIE